MGAPQQMNPLFKMGQGIQPGSLPNSNLHPHHTGMSM